MTGVWCDPVLRPGLERVKKTPQVAALGMAVARLPVIQPRPGDVTPTRRYQQLVSAPGINSWYPHMVSAFVISSG
jgi:hypothetical protein